MKTKIINVKHLQTLWDMEVKYVLFPNALIEKLTPQKILDGLGDNLSAIRENRRAEIDAVIEQLISSDTPQILSVRLFELEPMIAALYFDRIQAATLALGTLGTEMVEIPESWHSLTLLLLQQKMFQS